MSSSGILPLFFTRPRRAATLLSLIVFLCAVPGGTCRAGAAIGEVQPGQTPIGRAEALLDAADALAALDVIDRAIIATGEGSTQAVPLLRMKGYIEVILRRDEAAIVSFQKVLDLARGDAFAALELAKRMHAVGRLDEARARYEAFLRAEPGHEDATLNLASLTQAERTRDELAKKIQRAHRRLLWLGVAALLVLVATLTVIRKLCR